MTRIALCLAVVLLLSAGLGCRTAPIMNVSNRAFVQDDDPSLEDARQAIGTGAAAYNWILEDVAPGEVRGTIHIREHSAVVRITFDAATFSIELVSSEKLLQREGTIHNNYNRWVGNLAAAIVKASQEAAL